MPHPHLCNPLAREELIEQAYSRYDDDLANQVVSIDEELTGVRPATAPVAELQERLNFWLALAAARWGMTLYTLQDDDSFERQDIVIPQEFTP